MVISRHLVVASVLLGIAFCAQSAMAQGTDKPHDGVLVNVYSLHGIRNVAVLVEQLPEEARSAGIDSGEIKTTVEVRLRQAGIPVSDDLIRSDATVYVRITLLRETDNGNPTGEWIYSSELSVQQEAYLPRELKVPVDATTWSALGKIGIAGGARIHEAVQEATISMVEQLLNDWLKVNHSR